MARAKGKASAPPIARPIVALAEGRHRAIVDAVLPIIDGGRYPIKRIAGQPVSIRAHCFTDGHDKLRAVLRWQQEGAATVYEVEMTPLLNDVWSAEFTPPVPGRYRYTVCAWVDHFDSWRAELMRREDVADIRVALLVGAALIDEAAARSGGSDTMILQEWSRQLHAAGADKGADGAALKALALDPARAALIARHADRSRASSATLELIADRKQAGFSSWYELFPRSAGVVPGVHGTFADVERRLPYIADMGFDVLYLPPIHPIGRVNRKGRNNALSAEARRCRQSLGHRCRRGRAQSHSCRRSAVSMISAAFSTRRASSVWKSPWISRFSARPIIRM